MSMWLQGGKVWEKAGVGVSVVYGTMPPEAYRAAKGNNHNSKPATNGVGPSAWAACCLCCQACTLLKVFASRVERQLQACRSPGGLLQAQCRLLTAKMLACRLPEASPSLQQASAQ